MTLAEAARGDGGSSGLSAAAVSLPGHVFWITGLSGAGKTTTANQLAMRLRQGNRSVVCLDGDELRRVYGDGLEFTLPHRRTLAFRHARLCHLLASQGFDVICSTISLFHDCHAWCREHLLHYHEIYLRVTMEELIRRDSRGLYRQSSNSGASLLVGVDLPVEEPVAPHLLIEHDGRLTAEAVTDRVWAYVSSLEGFRCAG